MYRFQLCYETLFMNTYFCGKQSFYALVDFILCNSCKTQALLWPPHSATMKSFAVSMEMKNNLEFVNWMWAQSMMFSQHILFTLWKQVWPNLLMPLHQSWSPYFIRTVCVVWNFSKNNGLSQKNRRE